MKIIIIGGVAAGMSAASKIKRTDPDAEVIVYEKGRFLSYGACGLPYYVSGANDDYRKMIARTREQFEQAGIHTRLRHEVIKLVPESKRIMVKDLEKNKVFLDHYDKLMIATGTVPVVPPLPGKELPGVHVLKTLEDGIALKEKITSPDIQDVVIVGGGYIGIEVAEAMVELGKRVRVVELGDRILKTFDQELTDIASQELLAKGVSLNTGEKVEKITGTDRVAGICTDKGTYPADLVILSVGVKPATGFVKGTDIRVARNGAVIIDREMRTSVEDIYAAGDCAEVYSRVMEENTYIPLGTTANKCGRITGVNLLGKHEKFIGTLGSAAIKVLGLELGRTGMSEEDAKRLAIDYGTVWVSAADHPKYYPDPAPIHLKLIYEKRTGVLLGAQGIGEKGVVLRIDILAVAIHNRMTAAEMGMVDLCYAPPFAGVWDAVHIACNAIK
ncbi:CoA-disulfide reductase [Paenibacillus sp. MER TA 81-3]|uniref:CoA-disulfide reductase n=1 Tax=Paenibacillus sp. MER TA 81-3 TaxID=2939573 RepID=UPI00204021C8|nr:CoA-disulfide reductase [Paenibacillus sp. MER TA 81-3]MCM3340088.1 CoA-disulfide reductase [Paenibacillus sp. MER TA 81-3]